MGLHKDQQLADEQQCHRTTSDTLTQVQQQLQKAQDSLINTETMAVVGNKMKAKPTSLEKICEEVRDEVKAQPRARSQPTATYTSIAAHSEGKAHY